MKYSVLSLFLLILYSNSFSQNESAPFMPDFSVKTDDYTVLIAQDGTLTGGLKLEQKADHKKFHVKGWTRKDQNISWDVNVPTQGNFEVNVLLQNLSSSPFFAEVSSGSFVVSRIFQEQGNKSWQRLKLNGTLRLNEGKQKIVLRIIPVSVNDTLNACVYSIELVLPSVRQRLSGSAMSMRANCQWFRDAGYGLMFHWTRGVSPLSGDPKPYADAVRDFNVDAFATQVAETGAGFVTLTTTHAFHYFPAPLKALDSILPGRTAQRDLIANIADALGKRGIKLLLYYNLGSNYDPEWLKASGFWNSNPEKFFNNWIKMISEIGARYKDKVAGFWFDDGTMSYYYRSAPWEKLAKAAKAGYSQRMISYNPWVYPSATEFQDFYPGEVNLDPQLGGSLKPGDNGIISSGSHRGLQASAAIIMEKGSWARKKNTEFSLPRWNSEQLAKMIQQYKQYKNVPMFNLEILEDGTFSPKTVEVFRYARKLLTNIAGPEIKTVDAIPIKTNRCTQLYGTTASQRNGTLTRQGGDNYPMERKSGNEMDH